MEFARYILLVATFLSCTDLHSQIDSEPRRWNAVGLGIIVSNSNSHYLLSKTTPGRKQYFSDINNNKLNPGGSLAFCFNWTNPSIFLQLGLTETFAEYRYRDTLFVNIGANGGGAYLDYHVKSSLIYFNVEFGERLKLFRTLYLQSSLILNLNALTQEKQSGQRNTRYSSTSHGTITTYTGVEQVDTSFTYRKKPGISYKFSLLYNMPRTPVSIYVFRNFGLIYKLPWWGSGILYRI